MLWLCTFQTGLIIYVSLLLLAPKILSVPFDPQDNDFLSWAHPAAFHNWSNWWVCGALPSSSWKASCGGHRHFKKKTFSKSANTFDSNHMWCLFYIWWHLPTLNWTGATLCTLTMDIMWLLILIIHYLGLMTISLHIRQIGLDLMVFYLTFNQIWDEVMWLTPEKGRLISTGPICWEQIEPSPKLANNLITMIGNNWDFCFRMYAT